MYKRFFLNKKYLAINLGALFLVLALPLSGSHVFAFADEINDPAPTLSPDSRPSAVRGDDDKDEKKRNSIDSDINTTASISFDSTLLNDPSKQTNEDQIDSQNLQSNKSDQINSKLSQPTDQVAFNFSAPAKNIIKGTESISNLIGYSHLELFRNPVATAVYDGNKLNSNTTKILYFLSASLAVLGEYFIYRNKFN